MELLADHAVCREGETLGAHQAAVLRIFDVKMAAFRMRLLACWHADGAPLVCAGSCQHPGACACTDLTPTRSVRAPGYHQHVLTGVAAAAGGEVVELNKPAMQDAHGDEDAGDAAVIGLEE